MPVYHVESILEALSFFPLLGRFIRSIWKRFQGNPNKQPISNTAVDDLIADSVAIVSQSSAGDNSGALAVAQGSGTMIVIKQLIVYLGREPNTVNDVQRLVSQYPDDSDLGYQVCRYAAPLLSSLANASDEPDGSDGPDGPDGTKVEATRSYWDVLRRMVDDNHGRNRRADADGDNAE